MRKKNNQPIEKQEEDALVLWDCVSLFDTEEEGYLKQEEISETNRTTRSQGLIKEDRSVLQKNQETSRECKENLEEQHSG